MEGLGRYILDEVDAALDVSHTTNIGRMIKEYFPQAQFIIVSLKDGMFNNANVLFRTPNTFSTYGSVAIVQELDSLMGLRQYLGLS